MCLTLSLLPSGRNGKRKKWRNRECAIAICRAELFKSTFLSISEKAIDGNHSIRQEDSKCVT